MANCFDSNGHLLACSNLRPRDARTDEVVIGCIGPKSKDCAVNMVSKIIDDKDRNPKIIMDKMSFAPIKFDSA